MVAKKYSQEFYFPSPVNLINGVSLSSCTSCTTIGGTTDDSIRQKLAERDSRNMRIGVWRRLEDEMPEPNIPFLGFIEDINECAKCILYDFPDNGYNGIDHAYEKEFRNTKNRGVTHWMKLPDPPVD